MHMDELSVFQRFSEISESPATLSLLSRGSEYEQKVAEHRQWLKSIRRERPNPAKPYRVGVYIRYFNQTRYDNYLAFHKQQFEDTIADCPLWSFEGFYVDEGATAPNMETAPEWCRLLNDCMNGKIDLIITQKVSNISRKVNELTFCARLLAAHEPPIGIYFISEDIFTLATYYQDDLKDRWFFPSDDWKILPGPGQGGDQD